MTKPYGTVTCLRGETDAGQILDAFTVTRPGTVDSVPREKLWPLEPVRDVFRRERLHVEEPAEAEALWIAKADALPEDWKLAQSPVVWTAGTATWAKLARRGIWVNGTADGLGESEAPRVDTLCGRPPRWIKLSHADGVAPEGHPLVATYRLEPRRDFPDLTGKTHFFWSSGSLFLKALEAHPWVADAHHACGPGHTHDIIREALPDKTPPAVFLSHGEWLDHYSQKVTS